MQTDELIAALTEATGPDRELDAAIAVAKGWNRREGSDWFTPPNLTVNHHISELPRYTASIDAALTLRPEGALYAIENYDSHGVYPEHVRASAWVQGAARAFAATPALAICTAALKARVG